MIVGQTQLERRAISEIIQYRATAPLTQHLYNGRIVSTRERVIKEVQAPTATIPTDDQFFSKTEKGKPNVTFLKDHFYHEGRIKEEHALYIIKEATRLLRVEPNVLTIDTPAIVCGDIRGQYYDLMNLFEIGGDPANTSYLFLGNYAGDILDMSYFDIECLLYLWTLKIWYSKTFFLLRGFNEARRWDNIHTFETECKHKYSKRVYEACLKSFCALPLAAIMDKQFLCIHSGISPKLRTIDDIRKLNRFREPPTSGLMNDILRLNPVEDFGQERGTETFVNEFGYSYSYTYKAVCDFLDHSRLSSVIRAHSMQPSGYRMYRDNPKTGFPSVMTIFSAPDYRYNTKAAIVKFEKDMFKIWKFDSSPHPYCLPNSMNAFSWSLPVICKDLTDMVAAMLNICTQEELNESAEKSAQSAIPITRGKSERDMVIKNKILVPPLLTSTSLDGGTSAAIGTSSKTSTRGGGMSANTHATTSAQGVLTPSTRSPLTLRPPTGQLESRTVSLSDLEENSNNDTYRSGTTTSESYSYTVKSVNSRKSRTTVLYPRPVRPRHIETIPESTITGLDDLNLLSDQPVSSSTSPHGDSTSLADKRHIADVIKSLSLLFNSSAGKDTPVERRLSASWKSLLEIKSYEENHTVPNLRATKIYADTLLNVHNEIVKRHLAGAPDLTRPCLRLNEAFSDAYILLSNLGTKLQALESIPALEADAFKSFLIAIMQLSKLISSLEVLVDFLSILTAVKSSNVTFKRNGDDVISNVPGQLRNQGSESTLLPAAVVQEDATDNVLRLVLVTRKEELERELRGLQFLLWRANPKSKVELKHMVQLMLPLHHEKLMKNPVEEYVVRWQAAIVPH